MDASVPVSHALLHFFHHPHQHALRAILTYRGIDRQARPERSSPPCSTKTGAVFGFGTWAVLGHLIDAMMELSGMREAKFHLKRVDLAEISRKVISQLQQGEKRGPVAVVIPESLPAEADADLISILLHNLLGNAWKFTGKCAEPKIEVGVLTPSNQEGVKKTYFVKDNGAGFDMKQAADLFLPFRRLHGKSEFPGSGVGLATVHRIIERHGGKIWA